MEALIKVLLGLLVVGGWVGAQRHEGSVLAT